MRKFLPEAELVFTSFHDSWTQDLKGSASISHALHGIPRACQCYPNLSQHGSWRRGLAPAISQGNYHHMAGLHLSLCSSRAFSCNVSMSQGSALLKQLESLLSLLQADSSAIPTRIQKLSS